MRVRFPVAFLMLAVAGVASAQSLSELAEKEKERRKAAAAAGSQAFTNDDLEKVRPSPSPTPSGKSAAASPAAKPAANAASSSADSAGAEASWRQQAQAARDAITAAEQGVAKAESALGSVRTGISQPLPSDGLRQTPPNAMVKEASQEKAESDLAQARASLAQAKAALVDLEERARKASVPPGWLR